ncbi:hypothetical protein [Methanobrevibacter ruminantium]|nr:hypothetical protein [Methanobrevibacter ruminantium]
MEELSEDYLFEKFRMECYHLLRKENYSLVRKKIENFLEKYPLKISEENYFYFNNKFEENFYFIFFIHSKYVNVSQKEDVLKNYKILKYDYPFILAAYGETLIEFDEFSKAKYFLELANKISPFDIGILRQLLRIYCIELDREKIEEIFNYALDIVYDEYYLFYIYEFLSEYYLQINQIEIGNLLSQIAKEESFNVAEKHYIKDLFNKYDINLGFNEELISHMEYIVNLLNKKGDFTESYLLNQDCADLKRFNRKFKYY